MSHRRKVLFLELNEFNPDLLRDAANTLALKNLQKLVGFERVNTFTEDTYDSDFLEPWVQWVSVHTGTPSSEHQIKHLGDVPHLGTCQLWEELSNRGVSSGVWGAMNASRGDAERCLFFVPDPWTASENAYPEELNALLDPIRYVSKNYLNRSNKVLLQKIGQLLKLVRKNRLGGALLKEIPRLMQNMARYKAKSFVFIALFDYLSTLLFLQYKKKHNPEFSLIFLNSLAHLQHHHWKDKNVVNNKPIVYGLTYLDRILGEIFAAMDADEVLLVANALSQKNTNEEKPWILYRQKDQGEFLKAIGIDYKRVEPLMTHDAQIFFEDEKAATLAKKHLLDVKVSGQNLFLVEDYEEDKTKLFYRICFTDEVPSDTKFTAMNQEFRFFDLFQPIVKRTGKHIPEGVLFCNTKEMPNQIQNHEIFHSILDLFGAKEASYV